MFFNF
jgi:hypothetical protein